MSELENKSPGPGILVWLVVLALIGFLALIAIPSFVRVRHPGQQIACINNLRQIDAAKSEWALENGKTNGVVVTENDLKLYIKLDSKGNFPKCPQGGIYTIGKVGEKPTCSLGTTLGPPHVLP